MAETAKADVERFLADFHVKRKIYEVYFRDERGVNTRAMLELEISHARRLEIVESLCVEDFSHGPLDDKLYGIASMWVFGRTFKKKEIYIKISLGPVNANAICISFHKAERALSYPFKS